MLRNFSNYYRGVVSKEIFSYIGHRVWWYLWRWARRRHPNKKKKWVKSKYFRKVERKGKKKARDWVFFYKSAGHGSREEIHDLYAIQRTQIIRHVKVKGTKTGKQRWAKGSKYEAVADAQGWECPICHDHLFKGQEIETHHIVHVKNGGSDDVSNLVHLHKNCHKHVHSRKTRHKGLEEWLEPDD